MKSFYTTSRDQMYPLVMPFSLTDLSHGNIFYHAHIIISPIVL